MNFILFDIEATCWDGYHSNGIQEFIELGAIAIDRFGEETGSFVEYIRPEINPVLSQYCRDLTGISQEEVNAAGTFEEVYDKFENWVQPEPDTWFVSWGSFDKEILNETCDRFFSEPSMIQNHLDLRRAFTGMKNLSPHTSLVKALEHEEWAFEGEPHRAMPDTQNMTLIFREYFEYWGFN